MSINMDMGPTELISYIVKMLAKYGSEVLTFISDHIWPFNGA